VEDTREVTELTPLEREILIKLTEECSEVIKVSCKAQLHGIDSMEPGTIGPTNKEKIESELGDLMYFMAKAFEHGLLDKDAVLASMLAREQRPNQWLHHIPTKKE
jgi:phosphoribosyl-ATP pyrophosphohydrolase